MSKKIETDIEAILRIPDFNFEAKIIYSSSYEIDGNPHPSPLRYILIEVDSLKTIARFYSEKQRVESHAAVDTLPLCTKDAESPCELG